MGKTLFSWGKSATKREKTKGKYIECGPLRCMGSMFRLLKFSKSFYSIRDESEPIAIKGVEAPKSSLDEEESMEAKENLIMPIGIRIKTSTDSGLSKIKGDKISNDSSFNSCASPSANTPNLVARLMGLNHLPGNLSPSLSSLNPSNNSNSDQTEFLYQRGQSINGRYSLDIDINSSRSLSDSPRISASRRSDVDSHRLSLQSSKEHGIVFDDFVSSGKNKKVKQANERDSLGRNFGTDISNNYRKTKEQRKDNILLAKTRKPFEKKNKETKVSNSSLKGVKDMKEITNKKIQRSKSNHCGQSTKRIQKPCDVLKNKKDEMFVCKAKESTKEKKPKKTAMLGEILNLRVAPISPTKLPCKQESDAQSSERRTHVPRCLSKPYNFNYNYVNQAQLHYILKVLKFLGIDENTAVSFAKLHSLSHPLHPSVFDCLEHTFSDSRDPQMRHRSNRKLLFELVDEILVDVLKPYLIGKPWVFSTLRCDYRRDGSLLINQLYAKIRSFQAVDCNVLEDIDQLIDKDFRKSDFRLSDAFEEESETIVAELEGDIIDSLLHEILLNALF